MTIVSFKGLGDGVRTMDIYHVQDVANLTQDAAYRQANHADELLMA